MKSDFCIGQRVLLRKLTGGPTGTIVGGMSPDGPGPFVRGADGKLRVLLWPDVFADTPGNRLLLAREEYVYDRLGEIGSKDDYRARLYDAGELGYLHIWWGSLGSGCPRWQWEWFDGAEEAK